MGVHTIRRELLENKLPPQLLLQERSTDHRNELQMEIKALIKNLYKLFLTDVFTANAYIPEIYVLEKSDQVNPYFSPLCSSQKNKMENYEKL